MLDFAIVHVKRAILEEKEKKTQELVDASAEADERSHIPSLAMRPLEVFSRASSRVCRAGGNTGHVALVHSMSRRGEG